MSNRFDFCSNGRVVYKGTQFTEYEEIEEVEEEEEKKDFGDLWDVVCGAVAQVCDCTHEFIEEHPFLRIVVTNVQIMMRLVIESLPTVLASIPQMLVPSAGALNVGRVGVAINARSTQTILMVPTNNKTARLDENKLFSKKGTGGGSGGKNSNKKSSEAKQLLSGEGKVGTYKELLKSRRKGDNITPHHMPSADYMKNRGVAKNDGVCMNMEQPTPGVGGRHRATRSYGSGGDPTETPREALARDVRDARKIYQKDGVYTPEIRKSLQEVIDKNKELYKDIFKKNGR